MIDKNQVNTLFQCSFFTDKLLNKLDIPLKFYNSYIELGEQFFQRSLPFHVPKPQLLLWNNVLADDLLITRTLQNDYALLANYGSGNELPQGVNAIALAYAGHQFGYFNANLGDGRAHLLGELIDKNGIRRDIQLKGSGQTVFSRRGDGKCALGPAIREYIMSEALYALGVPTSRCLAVVSTGESINRGTTKLGAVVTRVAASHIRIGSFEYFAARGDIASLTKLLNYTIERHFPDLNNSTNNLAKHHDDASKGTHINNSESDQEHRILTFLERVLDKQITLITQWLRIGFIHGVMNTDNSALCGETIDFGPCAMMGVYDPKTVFSSMDENGRYAFGNQGNIGQWNMARLADCLLLLLNNLEKSNDVEVGITTEDNKEQHKQLTIKKVEAIIQNYTKKFEQAYYLMYANKLGMNEVNDSNKTLVNDLLAIMKTQKMDYTQTFYVLTKSLSDTVTLDDSVIDNSASEQTLKLKLGDWYMSWLDTLKQQNITTQKAEKCMLKHNPVVIPRNHHIEALLDRCEYMVADNKDINTSKIIILTEAVDEFLQVLLSPYQVLATTKKYQDTGGDSDEYYRTFCGT